MIDKAGIEINVNVDAFVDLPLLCDDFGSQAFHQGVKRKFFLQPLFFG
jgi:hypothetical protein